MEASFLLVELRFLFSPELVMPVDIEQSVPMVVPDNARTETQRGVGRVSLRETLHIAIQRRSLALTRRGRVSIGQSPPHA
jgi:hypothetical protein